jgi:hypothetical protein
MTSVLWQALGYRVPLYSTPCNAREYGTRCLLHDQVAVARPTLQKGPVKPQCGFLKIRQQTESAHYT